MRPGDREIFDWHPGDAVDAFECILVTHGAAVPDRAFAVAVHALDAHGELITPQSSVWFHSDLLKTHCQYAPGSPTGSSTALSPWTAGVGSRRFRIEAVAWPSGGADIPAVIGLGISAVPDDLRAPRGWQLLTPQPKEGR